MANTGKSELDAVEKKEYDDLVARVAPMSAAQREITMLSAMETSVLLKISIGTLDRARSKRRELQQAEASIAPTSHASIPFSRPSDDGPVQYFVQDVVDFLTRLRAAAQTPPQPIAALAKLEGIRSWLARGSAADDWPFSIQEGGRPMDMMDAISVGALTGAAERLTLREFGDRVAQAAAAEFSAAEKAALEEACGPASWEAKTSTGRPL